MKIALVYGKFSSGNFGTPDPKDLYTQIGLTGSESYFFNTAKGLADLGHEVTAFFTTAVATTWSQVKCVHLDNLDLTKSEAVISWNEPDYLRMAPPNALKVCCQQYNDYSYAQPGYESFIDVHVSPSTAHAKYMRENWGVSADKQVVLPNSINPEHFTVEPLRDQYQIVWSSSPDRGLQHMLEWFPEIRRQVPKAKLNIYYKFLPWVQNCAKFGFDTSDFNRRGSTATGIRARYIAEALMRLGTLGENGVKLIGPVPNTMMAEELKRAGVLAYPCDTIRYTEGFGVAILDACAAGVVPVISDRDALGSIYQDAAEVIPGKPDRERWIPAIVKAMTDNDYRKKITDRCKVFAEGFYREKSAKNWEQMLLSRLGGRTPQPKATTRKKIAIFMDPSIKGHRTDFNPENLLDDPRGLSGTELAAIVSAQWLAKKHDVTLFTFCSPEGEYNGLKWKRDFDRQKYDVGIAHFDPRTLISHPTCFTKRIAMFQSGDLRHVEVDRLGELDQLLAASYPQMKRLSENYPYLKFKTIENSVNYREYEAARTRIPKVKGRVIWNASPDRGLHHLLQLWPRIVHHVPNASLRIFYGLENLFATFANPALASNPLPDARLMYWRVKEMKEALTDLKEKGMDIEVLGSVSRRQILEEEVKAEVLGYSCDPPIWCECYPTSILECCAAGAFPVITDADSLPGIFKGAAFIVEREKLRDHFADHVVAALMGDCDRQPAYDLAKRRDYYYMCSEWDALLEAVCA